MFIVTIRYQNKRAKEKYINIVHNIYNCNINLKIAEAHHRHPYLHEFAITVYGHDNSQTE